MYFPRKWEFGSALPKLRNFGGFEPPNPPPFRYATDVNQQNALFKLIFYSVPLSIQHTLQPARLLAQTHVEQGLSDDERKMFETCRGQEELD
jgi:hypothetical protein